MKLLTRLFLRVEYGFHMVDARLACEQGRVADMIDSETRAQRIADKLQLMEIVK